MSFFTDLPAKIRYHARVTTVRIAAHSSEFGSDFVAAYAPCAPFTMTSVERMFALYEATHYIHRAEVGGAVVECGVWRGGSSMLAAHVMARYQSTRKLLLFDTFTGMPEPGPKEGPAVHRKWAEHQAKGGWAHSPRREVERNIASTGLASDRFRLVEGLVEDTIPRESPEAIALLRLDTDFYESTIHELVHLYPLLASGGVLIIDDYGTFDGARKAVDDYLAEQPPVLLTRIDRDSRLIVKP